MKVLKGLRSAWSSVIRRQMMPLQQFALVGVLNSETRGLGDLLVAGMKGQGLLPKVLLRTGDESIQSQTSTGSFGTTHLSPQSGHRAPKTSNSTAWRPVLDAGILAMIFARERILGISAPKSWRGSRAFTKIHRACLTSIHSAGGRGMAIERR